MSLAVLLALLPMAATAMEVEWCFGKGCELCEPPECEDANHVLMTRVPPGLQSVLEFSLKLGIPHGNFPAGSAIMVLEAEQFGDFVFDLWITGIGGATSDIELSLTYEVSPGEADTLVLGLVSLGPSETIWVERVMTGPSTGKITVTRPDDTYTTGITQMVGAPGKIFQGVLAQIGAPNGRISMSAVEIE